MTRAGSVLASRKSLFAALLLTFVNSLGTGVIINGIYFLTGFGRAGNYALGAAMGAAYILAALTASRTLGALVRVAPHLSPRAVIAVIMGVIGLACLLPMAAGDPPQRAAPWTFWVIVILYGQLTGMLWPLVEAYVSAGRSGARLRSAVGSFNVVWSSAMVVAFVAMGPLVKRSPELVLGALGIVHIITLPVVFALRPSPSSAGEVDREPHPPVYTRLLGVYRWQLPASYMVAGALMPYLPAAMVLLEMPARWHTPLAAVWLLTRVGVFIVLERWHGWHGRWWICIAGGAALVAGFCICVLAPRAIELPRSIWVFAGGLIVFGIGMGSIYAGALYYALEVGRGEVASGGTHEALIGCGYLTGPLTGLAVVLLVSLGAVAEEHFEIVIVMTVACQCAGLAAAWAFLGPLAGRRARNMGPNARKARTARRAERYIKSAGHAGETGSDRPIGSRDRRRHEDP